MSKTSVFSQQTVISNTLTTSGFTIIKVHWQMNDNKMYSLNSPKYTIHYRLSSDDDSTYTTNNISIITDGDASGSTNMAIIGKSSQSDDLGHLLPGNNYTIKIVKNASYDGNEDVYTENEFQTNTYPLIPEISNTTWIDKTTLNVTWEQHSNSYLSNSDVQYQLVFGGWGLGALGVSITGSLEYDINEQSINIPETISGGIIKVRKLYNDNIYNNYNEISQNESFVREVERPFWDTWDTNTIHVDSILCFHNNRICILHGVSAPNQLSW